MRARALPVGDNEQEESEAVETFGSVRRLILPNRKSYLSCLLFLEVTFGGNNRGDRL